MKRILLFILLFTFFFGVGFAQKKDKKEVSKVDYRIDNMGYWREMAEKGYVPVAPKVEIPKAVFKGSQINSRNVKTEDSPDVAITTEIDQTELSVFVDPNDNEHVLNSNNSGNSGSFYGTSSLITTDGSQNPWGGTVQSTGGSNSGDPAATIGLNGRMYNGFINASKGQGVAYSDDGVTWISVVAADAASGGGILDKNHLWIDNVATSPHEGNIYDAWTDFGGAAGFNKNIGFVRSTDDGLTYSTPINLSTTVNAGSHNQGVNLQTGPNGEVYAAWSVYDAMPTEDAIGFAISTDGGENFTPATRIINNIKGIRKGSYSWSDFRKGHRVNSFPSMAVDVSGGTNNGNIYIVWANEGEPEINTGTNISVYMIKSEDNGISWSSPTKVNTNSADDGKTAYFPWITCDPETGVISVIYYDDRNVSTTEVETWVSDSYDGGNTWEDFRVSDIAFTPSPLAGMAGGYMGDYLGISARGGRVYPVWPDNRTGQLFAYCSPYETNNRARPTNLQIALAFNSGNCDLTWDFDDSKAFQNFVIYRDDVEIGTSVNPTFSNVLPADGYGTYTFKVTAMHDDGESSSARNNITWGSAIVNVTPSSLSEILETNQTSTQQISITNNGQLDLIYNLATAITNKSKAYCAASGAGSDEYISSVQFAGIDNTSGYTPYSDFTDMLASVDAGNAYDITVANGTTYDGDDLGVWIDWNQDEDFDDAGENVVCETSNEGQGTYTIDVPSNAAGGQTRMRIRIKYSGSDCGSPCGTTSYGEVEDYTVNVNSWLLLAETSGTVTPGNTSLVDVTFNSEDLEDGTYNASLTVSNNDETNPAVNIPVTLLVQTQQTFSVTPTASPESIFEGESSQLSANAEGGTGDLTYSWTSNPEGFTSTEENPTVSPTETTTYIVEVTDDNTTVTGIVTVNIEVVSINKINENLNFNVYPNPTNGIINVRFDTNNQKNANLRIVNQLGQIVFTKDIRANNNYHETIDLSRFNSGVYFISLKGKNVNVYKKIIIQ